MLANGTRVTFSIRAGLRRWRAWLHQRSPRKLRLCETLALGEKRFVSVVQFENTRYLLGGTGASITLLSQLSDAPVEGNSSNSSHGEAGQ